LLQGQSAGLWARASRKMYAHEVSVTLTATVKLEGMRLLGKNIFKILLNYGLQ